MYNDKKLVETINRLIDISESSLKVLRNLCKVVPLKIGEETSIELLKEIEKIKEDIKLNQTNTLICTKDLYSTSFPEKILFIKDKPYQILDYPTHNSSSYMLKDEEGKQHEVTTGKDGWLQYFK